MKIRLHLAALIAAACLNACGGGGGGGSSAPAGPPTLVWVPNHEKGVNSPGGGYQISIRRNRLF